MKIKLKWLPFLFIAVFYQPMLAQENTIVTITVSGQGDNQDEVKQTYGFRKISNGGD